MCLRDKSGGLVYLFYSGVVEITPELGLVLGGSPDAKTTEFGNSCKSFSMPPPELSLFLASPYGDVSVALSAVPSLI